jgi:hypothetical protein
MRVGCWAVIGGRSPDLMAPRKFSILLTALVVPALLHADSTLARPGDGPNAVADSAIVRSGRYTEVQASDEILSRSPRLTEPAETSIVVASGEQVAGAGTHVALPGDARYRTFGLPAIAGTGAVAFSATFNFSRVGTSVTSRGIFASNPLRPVTFAGRSAPDADGIGGSTGVFTSFEDPLLNRGGDIAFGATAVFGAKRKPGLWRASLGGLIRRVAIEGETVRVPGNPDATFREFISSVLADSGDMHFVASFAPGPNGAVSGRGIWTHSEDGLRHVLSEGQSIRVGEGRRVLKKFVALSAVPGSSGHDRIGADGSFAVRLTWNDGTQSVGIVADGDLSIRASTGNSAPSIAGGRFDRFGIPGVTRQGRLYVRASLKPYMPTEPVVRTAILHRGLFVRSIIEPEELRIGDHNDEIVVLEGDGSALEVLLREGGSMASGDKSQLRFAEIGHPVVSPEGAIASLASAIPSKFSLDRMGGQTRNALWFRNDLDDDPVLIGERLIDGSQVNWMRFDSVAYPSTPDRVPLVLAKAKETGVVTHGLWLADSSYGSEFLFGTRVQIMVPSQGTKTVQAMDALKSSLRSPAQRRSYNDSGQLTYRVRFTDGTLAILLLELP